MMVRRMISPKTGFLSFGKVLVSLLNSSVLRALSPFRLQKSANAVTSFRSHAKPLLNIFKFFGLTRLSVPSFLSSGN